MIQEPYLFGMAEVVGGTSHKSWRKWQNRWIYVREANIKKMRLELVEVFQVAILELTKKNQAKMLI